MLIEMLKNDEELLKGKFSPSFTFKMSQEIWENIAFELNAIPGARKSFQQWKKTWQDLKKHAKKKNTLSKNIERGTGGGPPPHILTKGDKSVLDILETTALEGDSKILESSVKIHLPSDINTAGNWSLPIEDTSNTAESLTLSIPEYSSQIELEYESFKEKDSLKDLSGQEGKINVTPCNTNASVATPSIPMAKDRILKNRKSRNLSNAIRASDEMISIAKHDSEMKENYYKKKLEILQKYHDQKLQIGLEQNKILKEKNEFKKKDLEFKDKFLDILQELI